MWSLLLKSMIWLLMCCRIVIPGGSSNIHRTTSAPLQSSSCFFFVVLACVCSRHQPTQIEPLLINESTTVNSYNGMNNGYFPQSQYYKTCKVHPRECPTLYRSSLLNCRSTIIMKVQLLGVLSRTCLIVKHSIPTILWTIITRLFSYRATYQKALPSILGETRMRTLLPPVIHDALDRKFSVFWQMPMLLFVLFKIDRIPARVHEMLLSRMRKMKCVCFI